MQIKIDTSPAEQIDADALAIVGFETEEKPDAVAVASPKAGDPSVAQRSQWLSELRSAGEFTGKLYDIAIQHHPAGLSTRRLIVIGGGRRDRFSTVEARRVAGTLVRALKTRNIRHVALLLEPASEEVVAAAAEGAILGGWDPDKYKTDPKRQERRVDSFTILAASGNAHALGAAVERGRIIAEAQNFARDLINEPGNKLTPAALVEAARQVASETGLHLEVLDQQAMQKLGMGALLGVAQGSSNPPFLIVLRYRPAILSDGDQLAFVGKGVTFDTGGISIKPAEHMEKMKYDMAGAAAVIGAMRALAQLKPLLPVIAYVPTVENMLNGNAQRPGDIVTTLSGKTVEVLNTDAEGRLILADAITYANRNGATQLVDAATLTGAIGIALGHHNMGAFTNNDALLGKFMAAAKTAGEKAWQLPMDEEYKDYLKSEYADLPNIGGRYGGSITAAWFLREFADPTPWVHLDIASTAWLDDAKPWLSKGPTGVALRSFVQLAMNWQPTRS